MTLRTNPGRPTDRPTTRRRFLQAVLQATVVVSSLLWPAARASDESLPGEPAAVPSAEMLWRARRLLADLRVSRSALELGGAYLDRVPEEAEIGTLLRTLGLGTGVALPNDAAALRAKRHQMDARDFAAGRVVELSGWLLSESEARICALSSLVWQQPRGARVGKVDGAAQWGQRTRA